MKKKYLDASNWSWLKDYTYNYQYVEGKWKGYISVVQVGTVNRRPTAHYGNQEVCLCDDGYKGVIFLPDDENWCTTAIYDEEGAIVEWYIDMTKVNTIDDKGLPYFEDLYLDIAVTPNFETRILDEDELQEALDEGIITKEDYDIAYKACQYVLDEIITDKTFMVDFLGSYLK